MGTRETRDHDPCQIDTLKFLLTKTYTFLNVSIQQASRYPLDFDSGKTCYYLYSYHVQNGSRQI